MVSLWFLWLHWSLFQFPHRLRGSVVLTSGYSAFYDTEITSKLCDLYYGSCQDKIVNAWYMVLAKKPPLPWRNEVTLDPTLSLFSFFKRGRFWLSKHSQDTAVVHLRPTCFFWSIVREPVISGAPKTHERSQTSIMSYVQEARPVKGVSVLQLREVNILCWWGGLHWPVREDKQIRACKLNSTLPSAGICRCPSSYITVCGTQKKICFYL